MVYRIHFTMHDLARTRLAEGPMPLNELDLAARALRDRSQPVRLDAWRQRVRGRLSARARMVLCLIPPIGRSPTFLTPARVGTAAELLEQVRATPRRAIATELAMIADRRSLPSWTRRLPDDTDLRERLFDGLADLYTELLAPYWTRITDLFAADRALRVRQLLSGGVDRLLAQANPRWMRWRPPLLEITTIDRQDADLRLAGQGIVLVPSVFCARSVVDETQPQPVVSYPGEHDQPLLRTATVPLRHPAAKSPRAVSALLGRTRAAVLNTIVEHPGCSTKELAALVHIASATASEHATVLREAGLIVTGRHRNTAVHNPTDLGVVLVNR